MITKTWKVYGKDGHRQRESFGESYVYDWTEGEDIRIISVYNSDFTGTNDYSVVSVSRNTEDECLQEFEGQLSDGIFENSNYGRIEEI